MNMMVSYYSESKEEFTNDLMEILNHEEVSDVMKETFMGELEKLEKSNKTLKQIIPPIIVNSMKVYVFNNKDEITDFIKKSLKNEKVKLKIKEYISTKVIGNMNPMVAKFISPDTIYNKIMDGILEYLEEPNSSFEMVNTICNGIDLLMNKNASEVLVYIPQEGKKTLMESIISALAKEFLDEKKTQAILDDLFKRLE